MKKYTIIVLALFVYAVGMFGWGYTKGTVSETEALLGIAAMSVVLVLLWFLYRRRERYREEAKKNTMNRKRENTK
ncbi:MAG: hypothetical protein LBR52_02150 [Prevotellaceae bacterium]|jgi:uncharacterized membrane protein|nr:hypothetical protein [Prevotellaceae bacterium]